MNIITLLQIIVSILVIALVLLQERSAGTGGLFGGGGDGGFYQTRRGMERLLFILTIVLVFVFAGLAILNLVI